MRERSRQVKQRFPWKASPSPKRYFLWVVLALVTILFLLSQSRWLFTLATRIRPGALYAVNLPASPETPKVIALTIDDGPSSATADILAVLERYDASATFFNISGHLPGHEAVVQQTVAAGHELGNHMSADQPSIRMTSAEFEADLLVAERAALPYLKGAALRWLRPGMGWYSADMVSIAQRHGYRLVLGSVFPYDTHIPSSAFAIAFILATVSPGDIIVLHDGEGRGDRTVKTLERILPALQERGYVITTVTGLTEMAEGKMLSLQAETEGKSQ